ncbi:RraA family protein [candidate division KSB1 bacterium]|nr:RraA family protein [candidate division KSB1 bacterium]
MHGWYNDIFKVINKDLNTAVVGDIMDKMGLYHQFLPPQIRPLKPGMRVAGRAMTVLEADTFEELSAGGQNPYLEMPFGLMLDALDDLKENEVYLCSGSSPNYALWGELMSERAIKLKSAGAVVNGYSRDSLAICNINFPTFSYGPFGQDQAPRGKVIDFRCRLEIECTVINEGDIIIGDIDGVCIVPRKIELDVIKQALEKAHGENKVRKAIQSGMSTKDAFDKYKIM